ncbi:Citrate transporter [Methylocella silvestris BL2]|uniref:Citrate transporter n=1 Tax=Methylocella silvestris (strain DSM 15510 / CIP 108128 / LMG 27833 / NCIMB 13906 / BL2) TaxID=395965 RepID=B8EJT5_METSB|nr:anion transporter [Methylocella silvestris]ACK49489.1 Citrate transporter [Methylocella silvestris BL2]
MSFGEIDWGAIDWRAIATIAIFLATLCGVAVGRAPGLRMDRAGMALVGAALMLIVGPQSFEESLKAVDLDTITLLLGMMIIVAQLRISGFFDFAGRFVLKRAHGPLTLLAGVVAVTGLLSAFLVNDAICLALTPLVLEAAHKLRRNPVPYLLAVAMASNAGSVATFTGNPQNMMIGVASHIPYGQFALRLTPIALVALLLTFCLIALLHRAEFSTKFTAAEPAARSPLHRWQTAKAALVTTCVIAGFFAGAPVAKAAIIGGSLLLVSRAVNPKKIYAQLDGALLLMFAGLFIVVSGAEKILLTPTTLATVAGLRLDSGWILSGVAAALSNLISNVPAVLVLKPFLEALPDANQAWLIVAMSSTLAGNLTLVGSIANLIVAERAKRSGVVISFLDYFKVGLPLTLLSLGFGTFALNAGPR